MFFERHGDPANPALLLSSGLGGSANYWRAHLSVLTQSYHVITYDQLGTGRSPAELPETYSIADMANEAEAILAQAGITRCHMIGHALGGLIALTLAQRRPALIDRLILVNAWAKTDPHTLRCFAARIALLQNSGIEAYVEAQPIFLFPAWWMAEHATRIQTEVADAIHHFPGTNSVLRRIAAIRKFDLTAALPTLTQPTLLITARDDILVPNTASDALLAGLPNATLATLPYGGHGCNVTVPEQFEPLCLDFLAA